MAGARAWALPLAVTVLSYGLAAGIWKQTALTAGQFCLLFVATKTLTNWGAWGAFSRKKLIESGAKKFMLWSFLGQLSNGCAWILYFLSLERGPAAIVQTMTAGYTALAALLALFLLKEHLAPKQGIGIVLVIAAAMIFGYSSADPASPAATGAWFVPALGVVFFWAVAVVAFKHAYNQPGADDYRFFIINWVGMLLTVLPYGAYVARGEPWDAAAVTLGLLIVLLYCIGDLTLFAAIQRGPTSLVSPLSGLYPIPTIAYAWLVLGERVSALQGIALLMVLAGIVLVVPKEKAS